MMEIVQRESVLFLFVFFYYLLLSNTGKTLKLNFYLFNQSYCSLIQNLKMTTKTDDNKKTMLKISEIQIFCLSL